MKVYRGPAEVTPPNFADMQDDNGRYSMAKDDELTEKYYAELEAALRAQGYTGKRTGKLVTFGYADGQAVYMVCEGSRGSMHLIWCEVGDAWDLPAWQTKGLTKKDITERVDAKSLFGAMGGSGHRFQPA